MAPRISRPEGHGSAASAHVVRLCSLHVTHMPLLAGLLCCANGAGPDFHNRGVSTCVGAAPDTGTLVTRAWRDTSGWKAHASTEIAHTHFLLHAHAQAHTHKHTTHTHAHVHARTYTHTQAHSNTRTDMLCRVLLYCPRLHLPAEKRERERLVSLFAKKPAPTNVSVYCTETEVCGSGVWGVGVRGRLCVLHKSQDLLEARADVPHSCPGACMK